MKTTAWYLTVVLGALVGELGAQTARLRPAEEFKYPTFTDGNSPSFWRNDRLQVFTSYGVAQQVSTYDPDEDRWESGWVNATSLRRQAIWIEAAWADPDGTIFGWYHHEPSGLHSDPYLTAPKIGALVSYDGGYTVHDLGVVLESGDPLDRNAKNGFFLGGHGDFSVVLDPQRRFFYFYFTNYAGPLESQGIAMARLPFGNRFDPVGKVQKYFEGEWSEPGLGGRMTPLFPAQRAWHHPDPDSFWGAAVHWNTHLNRYVMLLNHAAGEPGWSQEGIYISFGEDLSQPQSWTTPQRLMDPADVPGHLSRYYPQVLGLEPGGTDSNAGQIARFFLNGVSRWEIEFFAEADAGEPRDVSDATSPTAPAVNP